jgi:hypothetical protein
MFQFFAEHGAMDSPLAIFVFVDPLTNNRRYVADVLFLNKKWQALTFSPRGLRDRDFSFCVPAFWLICCPSLFKPLFVADTTADNSTRMVLSLPSKEAPG